MEFHTLSIDQLSPSFWELLLLADPCREMVLRYLEEGELHSLTLHGELAAEAVVLPLSPTLCELKNLAVREDLQGKGLGSALVNHLAALYQGRFQEMQVGTSDNGVPFYRRLGFLPSHVVANFFVDNYPEPIFDGGQQCVDMVYRKRAL